MNRRDFLRVVGVGMASGGLRIRADIQRPSVSRNEKQPNILFIVADDLGWGDVGFHGSEIMTPNIDALARKGVLLENHYVMPVCSPTRAGLLSGRYASRFGVVGPTNERVFDPGTVTLASALHACGYDTGITGKWHLGSKPEWGPLKFGFDRSYGSFAGGVNQYLHLYKHGPYSRTWHRNDQYVDEDGHATDLIAREAIRWIEALTERKKPFFIYVAFTAVHIPIQEAPQWTELYAGRTFDESRKRFAACATHMDSAIGLIIEALEGMGCRDDTLIIFTSDNGAQHSWQPQGLYSGEDRILPGPVLGSNVPLRGWKGEFYEGGIRVPTLVNWPGVLKPRQISVPVHIVDWMPTLCRLAQYKPQGDREWDGVDIWPLISGEATSTQPRTLYWKSSNKFAVRHGDWKLIVDSRGDHAELYDLAVDPYEKRNVAEQYPERVTELRDFLNEHRRRDEAK